MCKRADNEELISYLCRFAAEHSTAFLTCAMVVVAWWALDKYSSLVDRQMEQTERTTEVLTELKGQIADLRNK